jgi:hypothetical protein
VANILYRIGRLHLHRGFFRDALRFLQLGQIVAQDSGSELTVALLCANEAWAYALLGDASQATKSIRRAQDEFARGVPDAAPTWVRFFGIADLSAMTGMVYASLPGRDPDHLGVAVEQLDHCLSLRPDGQARSQAFELTALATTHLRLENRDQGVELGNQAVTLAMSVHSARTLDRLEPLERAARAHSTHTDTMDLAERISRLRAV